MLKKEEKKIEEKRNVSTGGEERSGKRKSKYSLKPRCLFWKMVPAGQIQKEGTQTNRESRNKHLFMEEGVQFPNHICSFFDSVTNSAVYK